MLPDPELFRLMPPLLTAKNIPADFCLTNDVDAARAAYRDPRYSHVVLTPKLQGDELRYILLLDVQMYLNATPAEPGAKPSIQPACWDRPIRQQLDFASPIRAGDKPSYIYSSLQAGMGREDFMNGLHNAALAFQRVVGMAPDHLHTQAFELNTTPHDLHLDDHCTCVRTDRGNSTILFSSALWKAHGAAGEAWRLSDPNENISLKLAAGALFEAPNNALVFSKPRTSANPGWHALPWRNIKTTDYNWLRLRTLMMA